jgi:hypothetical protein
MRPKEIVNLFCGPDGWSEATDYLRNHGVMDLINEMELGDEGRIKPDYRDLARLHSVVYSRKVFTILEFGIGYSTLVMTDALTKNRVEWYQLASKPRIRNSKLYELHSVDTDSDWIERTINRIPTRLKSVVRPYRSEARQGDFLGRVCHFYDRLPNVVPDFIYLDGPDPSAVLGRPGGEDSHWKNPDKVVMAADLLRIETLLLPGTLVLIDGRTANARFLRSHLYRNWASAYSLEGDVCALELQEAPLGETNRSALQYCLGNLVNDWNPVFSSDSHNNLQNCDETN